MANFQVGGHRAPTEARARTMLRVKLSINVSRRDGKREKYPINHHSCMLHGVSGHYPWPGSPGCRLKTS